jgi:hypothetical protein
MGQYSLSDAKPVGGAGAYKLADAVPVSGDKGFFSGLSDYNPLTGIKDFIVGRDPATGKAAGPLQGAVNMVTGAAHGFMDQVQKAGDAVDKGHYAEGALRTVASAVPVIGPAAANAVDEMAGGKPGEGAGHAVGLLASMIAPEIAGRAAAALPRAISAAAPGAEAALRSSAESQYARVLSPTTKANKFTTKAAVPELIDRGVTAGSLKGLQSQAQSHIAAVGQAIGDAWDNLPSGTKTDFEPIYDRLQSAVDDVHSIPDANGRPIPKGPEAERAIGNISKLQQTLLDVSEADPTTGKLQVPVEKVRALRQYFDTIAAKAGRYTGKDLADASASEAHGLAADAIRENLANDHPDIAALNKEYSFWKGIDQVVGDTIQRKQGQSKPLGQQLARGAGFIKGGILGAEAMDVLTQAVRSPAWGTVSAVLKSRLADAVASGNGAAAGFYAQKIAQAAALSATTDREQQTPPLAGVPQQ